MSQYRGPINDLLLLRDQMNRLFEEATERKAADGQQTGVEQQIEKPEWIPAADVYEVDGTHELVIDLPGIARETLDISVENDNLVVRGERPGRIPDRPRSERPHGRFARRFSLPSVVDQAKISANYKDGELTIRLPRRSAQATGKVSIKVT